MLDYELVVDVVNGYGTEPFHGTLAKEQWGLLTLYYRSINIMEDGIANLNLAKSNCRALADLTVSNLIVLLALNILLGQIAILEHEVRFNGGDGHI